MSAIIIPFPVVPRDRSDENAFVATCLADPIGARFSELFFRKFFQKMEPILERRRRSGELSDGRPRLDLQIAVRVAEACSEAGQEDQ